MSWFVLTLICMLGWGLADLFYKKSNVDGDRYSHLKTAVWVGLMMGFVSLLLTVLSLMRNQGVAIPEALTSETLFTPGTSFFESAVKYLPASLGYIISMIIGYAGMRYLEVSIVSPVQNASGALSAITMFVYFSVTGAIGSFWEEFTVLQVVGTAFIVLGVIALGIVEQRLAKAEGALNLPKEERKYRYGALALLFPILYCVFDTIGTAADGIILDEETGSDWARSTSSFSMDSPSSPPPLSRGSSCGSGRRKCTIPLRDPNGKPASLRLFLSSSVRSSMYTRWRQIRSSRPRWSALTASSRRSCRISSSKKSSRRDSMRVSPPLSSASL